MLAFIAVEYPFGSGISCGIMLYPAAREQLQKWSFLQFLEDYV